MLIPFDVFASVRHLDIVFQYHFYLPGYTILIRLSMYDLYFVCYVIMIYLCFIGLPFSYFYAQSVQDEEECKMQEQTKDGEAAADGTTYSMKNMDSSESSSEEDDEQKD